MGIFKKIHLFKAIKNVGEHIGNFAKNVGNTIAKGAEEIGKVVEKPLEAVKKVVSFVEDHTNDVKKVVNVLADIGEGIGAITGQPEIVAGLEGAKRLADKALDTVDKAKKAIELFDVIQSVDSVRLAEQLQRHAEALSRRVEIFAQVNTSGEGTKSGVTPAEAIHLARELANFPNLWLRGFMTIGAFVNDHEVIRTGFRTLRQLAVEVAALNLPGVKMSHLSMGMTNDFVIAIEEGSTMVRIGRAIFGERN